MPPTSVQAATEYDDTYPGIETSNDEKCKPPGSVSDIEGGDERTRTVILALLAISISYSSGLNAKGIRPLGGPVAGIRGGWGPTRNRIIGFRVLRGNRKKVLPTRPSFGYQFHYHRRFARLALTRPAPKVVPPDQ
jgi:hypothetical protein